MPDHIGQVTFDKPGVLPSLRESLALPAGPTLILVLGCIVAATAAASHFWIALVAIASIPAVLTGCWAFGARPFCVWGLVFSSSLQLVHHFIYRPYIGASDGLTIELTDLWTLGLLFFCASDHQKGIAKSVRGLRAFLVPIALLLMADIFSFVNSGDMELSFWGLLTHIRVVALFTVLVVAMAQGIEEFQAALVGIVSSVIGMGSICIFEMIFRSNIPRNAALIADAGESDFRSGGISSPTLAAALLATLLPMVVVEYFYPVSRSRKMLAGLGICVGLAGIGCTLTRSAAGVLVFASIPLIVFLFRDQRIKARHFVACGVVLACLGVSIGDRISERVDEGADNLLARAGLLGTAVNMASNSPLFGEGINNYDLKMDGFIPHDQRQKFEYVVHNKFFLTLAETGIVGLAALVWVLSVAVRRAASLAHRGLPVGVGLLCSMIVLVFEMNVESYDSGMNLLFAFVLMAIAAVVSSHEIGKAQQDPGLPNRKAGRKAEAGIPFEPVVLTWKK